MILIAILISLVAIGAFCWLLFTLATFALPAFIGFSLAVWAYHTGAGILGALIVGLVGAVLTLALGQFLLIAVRPTWARLLIVLVFVAPAALAGFHATHGIVKYAMPSEAWQFILFEDRRGRGWHHSLCSCRWHGARGPDRSATCTRIGSGGKSGAGPCDPRARADFRQLLVCHVAVAAILARPKKREPSSRPSPAVLMIVAI